MSGRTTARAVALDAIRRVIDDRAYSNRLISALLSRSGLDRRDRAFAAELAYGTLRHRLWLDVALQERASRPIEQMSPGAAHALRLGAYQLLVANVAPHAAVGETVELVAPRERGFVNAVLRRLADDPPNRPAGGDDGSISLRTGLTSWAIRELRSLLGDETEEAAAGLATNAALCLRATQRSGVEPLEASMEEAGIETSRGEIEPTCVLMSGGNPSALPGYPEGAFAIQDQASCFVVRALDPRPGERIADLCAAPGGKALFASELLEGSGVVVASDVNPRRMQLIAGEAARLGVGPMLLASDARAPALRGGFDRVLVDAPCSGIGSARRRPELLWRVEQRRLSVLAKHQTEILLAAADLLREGGRLVYAVCTFPRIETDAVCDAFERALPAFTPVPTPGPDGPLSRHRLWPHRHGSDAMFVASYERTS